MGKIISELESLLPEKPPKFVLAISTLLSVALYNLPVYDILATGIERVELRSLTLRLLLAGSILLVGFVTLVFILAYHNKKITAQNAELKFTLGAVSTDAQDKGRSIKTLQPLLATTNLELETLKKSHAELERIANERKFLLDTAEKKIAELSKPIEPASASSAPGPDDYHAPRRRSLPGPKIPWDKY